MDFELDVAAGALVGAADDDAGLSLGEAEDGGLSGVAGEVDGERNRFVVVTLDCELGLIAGADELLAEVDSDTFEVAADEPRGHGLIGAVADFDVVRGVAAGECEDKCRGPQPCEP